MLQPGSPRARSARGEAADAIAVCPSQRAAMVYALHDGRARRDARARWSRRALALDGVELVMWLERDAHERAARGGHLQPRARRAALRARRGADAMRAAAPGASRARSRCSRRRCATAGCSSPPTPTRSRACGRRSPARPPVRCCSRRRRAMSSSTGARQAHVGGGSHGSLHACDSLGALVICGLRAAASTSPRSGRSATSRALVRAPFRPRPSRSSRSRLGAGAGAAVTLAADARALCVPASLPAPARVRSRRHATSARRRAAGDCDAGSRGSPAARPRAPSTATHASSSARAQATSPEAPVPVRRRTSLRAGRRLSADQVLAIAERAAEDAARSRAKYPGSYGGAYLKGPLRWQVSFFSTNGKKEIGQVIDRRLLRPGARTVDRLPGRLDDGARLPGRVRRARQRAVRLAAAVPAVPRSRSSTPAGRSRCCTSTCSCCCRSRSRSRSSTTRTSTPRCRSPTRRCSTCSRGCSRCCGRPRRGAAPGAGTAAPARPGAVAGARARLPDRLSHRAERDRLERDRRRLRGRDRRAADSSTASRCTAAGRPTTNTATPTARSTTRPTSRSSRSSAGAAPGTTCPPRTPPRSSSTCSRSGCCSCSGGACAGRRSAIALAYAWVSYPFTLFALESNSNDTLVAVLVLAALLASRRSRAGARGAFAALAGLTKFAPLALAPLLATYGAARRAAGGARRAVLGAVRGCLRASRRDRRDLRRSRTTRCTRSTSARSPTRPTAARPSRSGGCTAWHGAADGGARSRAVALALALAVVPRRDDLVGLAAACAAILIAVQLGDRTLVLPLHPLVLPARDARPARALRAAPGRGACAGGRGIRICSIASARSACEQRMSTPISHGSSSEVSKRTGICVTQRLDRLLALDADHAAARAGHADVGDVGGPARAARARRPSARACGCPTTAVTRPSRCQPIATFSEVASACMSTSTWSTSPSSPSATSISVKAERPARR